MPEGCALIMGATSCAGHHLARALVHAGRPVVGTRRPGSESHLAPAVPMVEHEAGDTAGLAALLRDLRPEWVFYLIGAARLEGLDVQLKVVMRGLTALFSAVKASPRRPVIVYASSSAVFGLRADAAPLGESAHRLPAGDYGLAKLVAEEICTYTARHDGLAVRIARPFNHPGPGERPGLVAGDYARRLVAIERGLAPPTLQVKGAHNVRDFVDVRDVAQGYRLIAERGRDGEFYNLCSGVGTRVGEVVEILARASRLPLRVEFAPEQAMVKLQVGDPTKAERELGWTRRHALQRTLLDLLEEERKHS